MAMGLTENLKALMDGAGVVNLCKFGSIYKSLPEEERKLLGQVLCSGATTMDITRALNVDGIKIRREFVGEKRKCFLNNDIPCCLGDERKGHCK